MPIPETPAVGPHPGEHRAPGDGVYASAETPAGDLPPGEVPAGVVPPFITATFMWDRREHARVVRQITRHMKGNVLLRSFGVLAVFLALVAILPTAWTGGLGDVFLSTWWIGAVAIGMVAMQWLRPWLNARAYARQYAAGLNHPYTFALTDEGVHMHTATSDMRVSWSGVRQAVETREFFLFYVSERAAHFLPKRVLVDRQLPQVRAFVTQFIPLRDATRA